MATILSRIDVQFKTRNPSNYVSETFKDHITLTWNDIFAGVAPTMISEASDQDLRSAFRRPLQATQP